MNLDDEWGRCAPLLQPALMGRATLDEVERAIREGRAMLWPGRESAAVTQACLHTWIAGGSFAELVEMERAAERWAREHGFAGMSIEGRKGWKRLGYGQRTMLVKGF